MIFAEFLILLPNQIKPSDLFLRLFDLILHPSILHDALLKVLNLDILFHADILFNKVLQLDIHAERDRPFK